MKRKFILLPITLTALAPAISLVGCGGDEPEPTPPEDIVDLEFTEKVGDLNYPGFAFNNFNIEQGEQYWFSVDFKKLPQVIFDKQKNESFGFFVESLSHESIQIDYDTAIVILNERQLTSSEWEPGEGNAIKIVTPANPWSKTDIFYFGVIFAKNIEANIYCLLDQV